MKRSINNLEKGVQHHKKRDGKRSMEGQNGMNNEEKIDKIFNLNKEIHQNKDHSSNETNEGQNSKDREEEIIGTENIREIEKDMDRDERTKSDVEEQTSAIEELKRMHKDTDNKRDNINYKDESAKEESEDLNRNSDAKKEGQSSKDSEEENLKTEETNLSKKDIGKRTNMVNEYQFSVIEESGSLDEVKDSDERNEEIKDNSSDLNGANPSLTDNKVKSDKIGIETTKKKDMDRANRRNMVSEDQFSAVEDFKSLDKDKDIDRRNEEVEDKSNDLNRTKPSLTDNKLKSDEIGIETEILQDKDKGEGRHGESTKESITEEKDKKDEEKVISILMVRDVEETITEKESVKAEKKSQVKFQVSTIPKIIFGDNKESDGSKREEVTELDIQISEESATIQEQKNLINQFVRKMGIMINRNEELETKLNEEKTIISKLQTMLRDKEDKIHTLTNSKVNEDDSILLAGSLIDSLPPMRQSTIKRSINPQVSPTKPTGTVMKYDQKSESAECERCKFGKVDKQLYISKEKANKEYKRLQYLISTKDQTLKTKELGIKSLSLEIKQYEINKKQLVQNW